MTENTAPVGDGPELAPPKPKKYRAVVGLDWRNHRVEPGKELPTGVPQSSLAWLLAQKKIQEVKSDG